MSNLLLLDAEGSSSFVSHDGDRVAPDFPPTWDEFVAARRRFFDRLSRASLRPASERPEPLGPPA